MGRGASGKLEMETRAYLNTVFTFVCRPIFPLFLFKKKTIWISKYSLREKGYDCFILFSFLCVLFAQSSSLPVWHGASAKRIGPRTASYGPRDIKMKLDIVGSAQEKDSEPTGRIEARG